MSLPAEPSRRAACPSSLLAVDQPCACAYPVQVTWCCGGQIMVCCAREQGCSSAWACAFHLKCQHRSIILIKTPYLHKSWGRCHPGPSLLPISPKNLIPSHPPLLTCFPCHPPTSPVACTMIQLAPSVRAGLVKCVGVCLQAFHAKCLGLEAAPPADWWCAQCRTERMRCFACGGFGASMTDAAVRKCSLGCCGRFYHVRSAWGAQTCHSCCCLVLSMGTGSPVSKGWGPEAHRVIGSTPRRPWCPMIPLPCCPILQKLRKPGVVGRPPYPTPSP